MKILALDIETAPNTAHVWGLFKQNIGINQIQETGRVMCFAAKWYDEKKIHFWSEHKDDHRSMIEMAHTYLDEADAVLSFNGQSFDLPTLNREFLKYDLDPPSPYRHIDLLLVAKKRFRFASNKMDHLASELGVERKLEHKGHELWTECMAGDKKAWREMERYNRQDVVVLEQLYNRMVPWIDSHPNHALYGPRPDAPTCTNCGSIDVHSRGVQHNKAHSYARYQCNFCGTWMRGRFTLTRKEPQHPDTDRGITMEAMDVLASDIKIVDATTRTAADGGFTLLFPGVFMPDGEDFTGRVDGPLEPAKLRTWCETVRGVYNARQSRKEAEETRRGDLRDAGGDEEDRPTGEPVPTVGGYCGRWRSGPRKLGRQPPIRNRSLG